MTAPTSRSPDMVRRRCVSPDLARLRDGRGTARHGDRGTRSGARRARHPVHRGHTALRRWIPGTRSELLPLLGRRPRAPLLIDRSHHGGRGAHPEEQLSAGAAWPVSGSVTFVISADRLRSNDARTSRPTLDADRGRHVQRHQPAVDRGERHLSLSLEHADRRDHARLTGTITPDAHPSWTGGASTFRPLASSRR